MLMTPEFWSALGAIIVIDLVLAGDNAIVIALAAEPESRAVAARLLAGFCSRHPGVQGSLHIGERAELLTRLAAGTDDVVLFALDIDGLPDEQRWSLAHPTGRPLPDTTALFFREALRLDAGGPAAKNASTSEQEEKGQAQAQWKSPGNTTPQ